MRKLRDTVSHINERPPMTNDTAPALDHYGPNVRRIKTDPLTIACQEMVKEKWETFATFNEMSNDYAYTESAVACRQRATKYIGGH